MPEKCLVKKLIALLCRIIMAMLFVVWLIPTFLIAQTEHDLADHFYKLSVLHKIDSLLQTKYVDPEKAGRYAREFEKKYESEIYDRYQDPKEFAGQITADLISITKDKHFNFRFVESSDMGEKPESALKMIQRLKLKD
jgi:hypothetical protein